MTRVIVRPRAEADIRAAFEWLRRLRVWSYSRFCIRRVVHGMAASVDMHRLWLGEIYVWAGEYRQVNMGKGDFMFAARAAAVVC